MQLRKWKPHNSESIGLSGSRSCEVSPRLLVEEGWYGGAPNYKIDVTSKLYNKRNDATKSFILKKFTSQYSVGEEAREVIRWKGDGPWAET